MNARLSSRLVVQASQWLFTGKIPDRSKTANAAKACMTDRVLRLLVLPLFLVATRTHAESITIQDPSFDAKVLGSGAWNNTLTPWQETGGTGNSNGFIENISGFSADGANHLGMMLSHNVWQDLGVTYQANSRYTLTVAVGNRSGYTSSSNQSLYLLADSAGTTYATGTHNASTVAAGTFADAPSLVFETGTSSSAIGKTIRVLLQAAGSGRSHFDRIQLTRVSTQAPTATTNPATLVTDTTAALAGTVNANGQSATVSFEYGKTTAYGSIANAVPGTLTGNTATSVATSLAGLEPNTTYHYRVSVISAVSTIYGSDRSFTTNQASVLALTPSSFSISARSGESATTQVSVNNTGLGTGSWSLEVTDANGLGDNLAGALAAIDASGTAINGPLPSRYDFSEGETGTAISTGAISGGTSVFSTGNKLTTSSGGPISYSNGTVTTAAAVGTGGSYFTRKLPGLFLFGGEIIGPSWFEVGGYLAYGNGTRQTSEFSITRNGKRWSAFVAKTPDYWRTINHLILVDQDGLTATIGTSSSDQKHRISGLTGKRRVFYMLYVTSTTAIQPDSVFEQLAGRLLDAMPPPYGSILSLSPAAGATAAGDNTPVTVTANATGVAPGSYPLVLRVRKTTGETADSANGSLEVTAPRITVPASIARTVPVGLAPFVAQVPLTATEALPQPWSASVVGSPGWLSVETTSGNTPDPLQVKFAPGSLATGTYRASVRITSGSAVFDIPVTMVLDPLSIRKFLPDPARPLVYAVNQNGKMAGQMLEIDPLTKQIKRTVSVGKEPSDLDLTADGNRLVVMNTSDPSLSIVDLATFTVTETISLSEFSNRNEDVGGHVKCGKGSIVYYVDEQWGPRLRVFDTATRTVLQTLGAQSGTSPNIDNDYGYGDIQITPARDFLFGWVQYGDSAGWAGTAIVRFAIGADGRLSGFANSTDFYQYGSNFGREPMDTPVLLTRDAARLIIKDRVVDKTSLNSHPIIYPDEIYSVTPKGEVAVGSTAIYAGEGGEILHTLATSSTVQAVLPDYSYLVYFNTAAKTIGWLDLPATLGTARLGLQVSPADGSTVAQPNLLKWLPVTGILSYQVYMGKNRSEVVAATTASPLYLGLANGNEMALASSPAQGQTYHWRVVPVDSTGATVGFGTTYSFTVSNLGLSRSSIAAETVQGVGSHPETIQLTSATPQSWTANESVAWIKSVTPSGTTPGTLTVEMDATGLAAGTYQGSVVLDSAGARITIPVTLRVYAANFVISEADLDLPYIYLVSQADVNSSQPSFLLRVNTATDKIESAVPCGSGVTDLAVHYFDNRIYLTNWKTGILRAFDRTTFAQVKTYQFAPVGAIGYGEGGIWKISAGKAGRLIIEESDQWIDIRLINTANGAVLATQSSEYAGDGEADPLGRYYYHSEALSSSDSFTRYDLSADTFAIVQPSGNASAGTVVMVPDGSKVAAGTKVFNTQMVMQYTLPANVLAATLHGDLLFTSDKAYNGTSGLQIATLPATTTVMSVSGDQKKLYQFPANSATFRVTNLSTIAPLPSRDLTPTIPNDATVIGTTQELGWSIEPVALSYDVYFGTSAAAVTAATQTSPEYLGNATGTKWEGAQPSLALGSTYYWRVDVVAFSGSTKGATWSFRVAPLAIEPNSLSVVLPAGSPSETRELQVTGAGGATWTASTTTAWLSLPATGGTVPGTQNLTIKPAGLAAGTYQGSVRFQSGGESWDLPVKLEIIAPNYIIARADLELPRIYAISQAASGTDDRAFLVMFDTATNQAVKAVPVGRSVTSLSVHYQENRIYLTNWASGVLRALDRTTLEEVRSYQFAPAGAMGYSNGDAYVVAAGRSGRIMVEEWDQWVDCWLVDTATGNKVATKSTVRQGGGVFEPSGRYYFHGEDNSSGAALRKLDTSGDKFADLASKRVETYSYYGSRLVAISGDGSRVFWNGGVFDTNLNVLLTFNEEVVESTYHGELLFTNTKAVNGTNGQTLSTLPVNTKVQAVSGDQQKLFLFNGAGITVVNLSTIGTVAPRGLTPGIPDGSVVIGTSQELSWSLEATALSYDVYFGSSAAAVTAATKTSPEYLGNATGTKWTGSLPTLSPGTTYYWRVDTNGFSSAVKGATWSFAVAVVDVAPRSMKLASPAGAPVPRQSLAMSAATATAWTASTTTPWITLRTTSGTTPGSLQYDINTTGLTVGTKTGSITVQSSGQTFTVPVELSIVTLNVTKLLSHPDRSVVYGINTALAGEGFSHLLEINPATAAIQRTLPIGFAPTDAALDVAAGKLYIANNGYSQSKVIDVTNWTELPSLPLGDTAKYLEVVSGGRLAVLSSETIGGVTLRDAATGGSLVSLNEYYNGNIAVPPSGDILYLAGSGTSGSNLKRYRIGASGFTLDATGPQINYGSANLVMSADGKRLFWQGRTLDENMNILSVMPSSAEIYGTTRTGDLAIGESAIWWSDSGTPLATLPYASQVAAVSMNDAYLVRFNATTRVLTSTAISSWTDLPGPWPRPGQILETSPQRFSWTPVAGATGYRIFIAADAATLQSMTTPTATVNNAYYDPAMPLPYGRSYSWRVDATTGSGSVAGNSQSFTIRFPQGPAFAEAVRSTSAAALSVADGKVLLGWGSYESGAQVFNFNSATGATKSLQSFSIGSDYYNHYFGSSVAVDMNIAAVGAYARANPASSGGNVFAYKPGTWGYWEQSAILAPPSPVANEGFGKGIAASGNLMLAGTSNSYSTTGRVVACITEPSVAQTQVFSASDGAAGDGFGNYIAMDGNRAIISAPGSGSSYNRIPCLYAFTRSTATGQWAQTQKITIPGATSSSGAGTSLALNGSTMAVRATASSIAVFNETGANQWTHSVTINSSSVSGASSFGTSLALHGDLLFVGDSGATYQGTSGGAVFVFRRNGTVWTPGPVITPSDTRSGFGTSLAAREGWLLVAGTTGNRPASVFRIDPAPNRIPRFAKGVPEQLVAGRPFSIPLTGEDADGNTGLVISKLQGPSWLALADNGNGNAVLSGIPAGASGTTVDAQFEVRDAAGAKSWWATRITLLAPTDLPVLTQEPVSTKLGVGQELTLRAAVSGIGPFQWQWYFNGNPIPGATLGTFVLGEVTPANAGRYQVRVSNAVGEDASADAVLTVHEANRYAGDWPTFGGSPSHTGRHPAALGETRFIPAWSQTLQSGYTLNRAAIADGRAVVVPNGYFATELATKAVDLQTGNLLWSFPFPSSYSSNPPSIHNGKVYFQRGKGTSDTPQLFCLNAATGSQIWASTYSAQWESYEAPAVSDQGVYVNGGSYGGMYGFNLDGSQRFFTNMGQYDDWTPTIAAGKLYSWVAGNFTEHNHMDGSTLWSVRSTWSSYIYDMDTVSAVAGDTAVVYGCNQSTAPTEILCIDLMSRSFRWKKSGTYIGSPAIGGGRVFSILGNQVVSYALDDGAPEVAYQTTAGTGSGLLDQPIIFNDRLAISSSSKTWIFNLEDGQLLQTLDAGGRLSYSNSYLLMAGTDGVLRAFRAVHDNANLASLSLSAASLLPDFNKNVGTYIATVPFETAQTTVTPALEQADAKVTVNGTPVASGTASAPVALAVGNNTVTVTVTAEDGTTMRIYQITVTRLPREFVFNASNDVPVAADGFAAGDHPAVLRLGFAPQPGTILTMVNNTSLGWIHGRFQNLAQGQRVTLAHGGENYDFVANYFGGTGNDLVLQWADTTLAAWGSNGFGQVGDGTLDRRLKPVGVTASGALSGKTATAVSAGYLHSLALTADGSVATWGSNGFGQLGNGTTANSPLPDTVDLSGKAAVAIAAGAFHNLALCSDGSIVSWGYNNHGQLGDGTRVNRSTPVAVPPVGALAGKRVVAIAAGAYQSFALCDDGTAAAWGYNDEGELGNGSTTTSLTPVAVKTDGVLSGRTITALSVGQYHTLALCADGGVVAWGYNNRGQIGDASTTNAPAPVDLRTHGVLSGKSVRAVVAGSYHSIALCTDDALAVWGYNNRDQLGVNGIAQSTEPVLAGPSGANAAGITSGGTHALLRLTDGKLSAWGDNTNGQLGDGTQVNRATAVAANFDAFPAVPVVMFTAGGSSALHSLAVVAVPTTQPGAIHAGIGLPADPLGDPDRDGIPNLVEHAFGLDPLTTSAGLLPQARLAGGELIIRFTPPAGVSGVIYGAEWSENLQSESWLPVPDTGTNGEHRFAIPATPGKAFIRLKVTAP